MRFGVLGSGDVGRVLGRALVTLGHDVKIGSRSAANEKAQLFVREAGAHGSAGTFGDAASFGEAIVLATLGSATEGILREAGPEKFRGKVVIDATNPLDTSAGLPKLTIGFSDSLGERVQRLLQGAHVVKAFNTVGHPHMFRPSFQGGPPDMFICGNNDAAKVQVQDLLKDFGWGTVDIGGIESSRYLEPMCLVWVLHGARTNTWSHAFKLLRN
jgi:predicted dinucleotide-binding enzyme